MSTDMFQRLFEIAKRLLAESEVDKLLAFAMDQAIEMSGAERGLIILFGEGGETLFEIARNLKKEDIDHPEFEVSRTIINKVKNEGTPICLRNALDDPMLRKSNSVARLKILSVICLPLRHNNEVFGVVYLDNRTVRGVFESETCAFMQEFADFISLAAYRALEMKRLQNRQQVLEEELRARYDFAAIVGHDPKMMEVLHVVSQVADTDAPVLIEGESGTGKELVARAIHFNSRRREMPMVSINCGAIPENLLESELFGHEKGAFTGAFQKHKGKFEQADGGTIFLDEVDEMSPALQVKLLRILQWGEFSPLGSDKSKRCDVRIVAAAKESLRKLVDERKFRDDLYYRLNLIRLEMPPLRERKEDIPILANYILQNACKSLSKTVPILTSEVQQALQRYNYPGNVRELENIIKRAAILCDGNTIKLEHLPPEILSPCIDDARAGAAAIHPFHEAKKKVVENFERSYIQQLLSECGGNIHKAAERAGMYERNFHLKLKRYGIHPKKS
jgi:transcriptional regulator with GAF, ATPase, and Fis domain